MRAPLAVRRRSETATILARAMEANGAVIDSTHTERNRARDRARVIRRALQRSDLPLQSGYFSGGDGFVVYVEQVEQ